MKSIHIFTLFVHAYFPNCRICLFSFFPWSTIGAFLCHFLFRGAVALFPSPLAPLSIFPYPHPTWSGGKRFEKIFRQNFVSPSSTLPLSTTGSNQRWCKIEPKFPNFVRRKRGGTPPPSLHRPPLFLYIVDFTASSSRSFHLSLARATSLIKKVPPPLQPFVHPRGRREGRTRCVCVPCPSRISSSPFSSATLDSLLLPSFLPPLELESLVGVGKEEESVAKKVVGG